jgi:hypothetical protein
MKLSIAFAGAIALALLLAPEASAFSQFSSPSGNIGCVMVRSGARCDVREHDWTAPPKPAWCELDWGSGASVGRRGRGSVVCAGDTALGGTRVLAYGDRERVGRFRCLSRRSGMRCVNHRNDHGFLISRQRLRLF